VSNHRLSAQKSLQTLTDAAVSDDQLIFDLLGDLIRFRMSALLAVDSALQSEESRSHFFRESSLFRCFLSEPVVVTGRTLANLVDSNVFIRTVLLAKEHFGIDEVKRLVFL
jgi:hypothetical protein